MLQSELSILRKVPPAPWLPHLPSIPPILMGAQSPSAQPWVFDQLLEGKRGPVVSALLPNLTVFVEIQLPASTQEFIPGILYLTLAFNKRR